MIVDEPQLSGHFIDSEKGQIFVTQFGEIANDTAIICLPSIFEELNLSRAVLAKQAQYFARHNAPCFLLDYYGTGDSVGECSDASAELWLQDVIALGNWLQERGIKRIILWGVRFGALLTLAFQRQLHEQLPIVAQLFWKPVLSGKQFCGQFIRIKQANSLMQGSGEKIDWRQHILSGNETEVAGYLINKSFYQSLESLALDKQFNPLSKIYWLELASSNESPLMRRTIEQWPEGLYSIKCLPAPAFWQVPEVFDLPEIYPVTWQEISPLFEGHS